MTIASKQYRIKSRCRFTAFVIIIALTLIILITTTFCAINAAGATYDQYAQITIESGDTLWQIAQEYMPSDMDVREAVHLICDINDISAQDLTPGMTIYIPA